MNDVLAIAHKLLPWAGWAGFALATAKWLQDRHDKRRADAKLALKLGPRLRVERLFANLGSLEDGHQHEFDLPSSWVSKPGEATAIPDAQSTIICLRLSNDENTVYHPRLESRTKMWLKTSPQGIYPGPGVADIWYNLDRSRLGQVERFTLHFEAGSEKLRHVYEARHGYCELRRVDPA